MTSVEAIVCRFFSTLSFSAEKYLTRFMAFPEAERCIYQKNPLVGVTCQLRFPTILRIDAELPADFQERIRDKYPFFQQSPGPQVRPPGLSVAAGLSVQLGMSNPTYTFLSADKQWTLSLTRDFLALTAQRYDGWERFKEHFSPAFEALTEVYRPHTFVRVGLRYQNVLRRSALQLTDTPWSALLNAQIAGPLSSPDIERDIQFTFSQFTVNLPNARGHVQINHGFVTDSPGQEICYLLDNDFFTTESSTTETSYVSRVLDDFNHEARNIFHWCITERLHHALEPLPVPA